MSQKTNLKPLAIALGTAFVTTLAATPAANASENPFAASDLSSGYMVAENAEGKCGASKAMDAKCGANKAMDAKPGEGKCGMGMLDADADGKITRDEFMKGHEAMFNKEDANGDGVIDANEMKAMEGKCGEGKCGAGKMMDKTTEGKCGAGK